MYMYESKKDETTERESMILMDTVSVIVTYGIQQKLFWVSVVYVERIKRDCWISHGLSNCRDDTLILNGNTEW